MPDIFAAPLALFLLLLSPAVGSFLAVLVDRLPRSEDVVFKPSRCRSCGTRLGSWDLMPILSFVVRRGKCRHCGGEIPPVTLYAELSAVGLAVASIIVWPDPAILLAGVSVLWVLLALLMADIIWLRLPDALTLILAVLGIVFGASDPQVGLVPSVLTGCGAALIFYFIRFSYQKLRKVEGLGLGDVKLIFGIGAMVGPLNIAMVILIASVGVLAVGIIGKMRGQSSKRPYAFGAALCAATILHTLLRFAMI